LDTHSNICCFTGVIIIEEAAQKPYAKEGWAGTEPTEGRHWIEEE